MKILYLVMIPVLVFSALLYIKPIYADNENGIILQNIQTQPPTIIIGQTFKITSTLVNNSSKPIFVEHGSCGAPFSVTFDNHVVIRTNNVNCTLELIEQRLDPGTKITSSSPNLDLTYVAAENGTVNATVSFPYNVWNQTAQSNTQENISKPFSFVIHPKTRVPALSTHDNQAIIDVALAIPDLQKWSSDWQYVSMGFMTAKNQPGNWQYAIVNLKASSNSSLIPCDNGWDAMVTIDRSTMKVISASYPTMESHNCDNYAIGGGPGTYGGFITKIETPLKQFKSGVAPKDIKCASDLQVVIKARNHLPACVKPEDVSKFVQRGWADKPNSLQEQLDLANSCIGPNDACGNRYDSQNITKKIQYYGNSNQKPKVSLYDYLYDGIDKDGLVSIDNQTFYETTLDNDIYKLKGISVQFHNVTFSFPEGALSTPGGAFVNLDVKFQDGFEETYGGTMPSSDGSSTMVGGIPIPTQYGPHVAVNSITVLGNHTNPQAGLTIYKDKVKLLVSTDKVFHKVNTRLPAAFEPCDTPYEYKQDSIPVLYMPTNSIGKICLKYSNANDTPEPIIGGIRIFDPNNSYQNATGITTWRGSTNDMIPKGNSTMVYWVKTGNQTGFYGLDIICGGMPFAVGYDNNSAISSTDFPFIRVTHSCPIMSYGVNIEGLTGIGVKYILYP